MQFSSALKLSELDDFLLPAQECVKPLIDAAGEDGHKIVTADELVFGTDNVKPQLITLRTGQAKAPDASKIFQNVENPATQSGGAEKSAAAAQVSLYDCLACSGCVTTADVILIQQQSVQEFMQRVQQQPLTVVSVSTQSLCSLAVYFGSTPVVVLKKLATLFKELGAHYVIDMTYSEARALIEARNEFIQAFKKISTNSEWGSVEGDRKQELNTPSSALPIFVSHCPGWVCYAEKTLPPPTVAHLSRVRSEPTAFETYKTS
eukprot:Selendium_serpulae@DN6024_c0_g2_i3.p1